jgi:hypothetical protein
VGQDEVLGPCSGDDDTFDVVDDAIAVLGLRRGLWMGDERVMIHLVASVIEQAERFLPHLVAEARSDGASWEDVARLLGTCPGLARLRFDPDSPVADNRWVWDA